MGNWSERWVAPAVAAAALAVYLATLAPGLTAAHAGVDGGDLVTAASTLGVPHPSGYPTYTLLAWLATRLPFGSPAYRVNLLSALCTAASAGLTAGVMRRLLPASGRPGLIAAAAGLSLAFSSLAWSQAVIAEVYALLLLCAALIVYLLVRCWPEACSQTSSGRRLDGELEGPPSHSPSNTALVLMRGIGPARVRCASLRGPWSVPPVASECHRGEAGGCENRYLAAAGLVLGLGLGNHLALVFVVPAVVVAVWARQGVSGTRPPGAGPEESAGMDRGRRARDFFLGQLMPLATGLVAGLLVYVYLPLAARGQPAVNWGDPQTWDRFVWVVTGQIYRPYVLGLPLAEMPGRLGAWAGLLGNQLGWWGLGLALFGAWGCWQTGRRWTLAVLSWALPAAAFAFLYATDDAHVMLLPLMVPMTIAWGMGVSQVFKIGSVEGLVRWLAPAIILLLPLLSLGMHWQAADLSGDREAEAYEARALEGVAPGALIMTQGDRATFWLWYGVYAERRRSDVAVVNAPLLSYRWYRDELRHRYPDLAIPEAAAGPTGLARATIEANIDRRPVYAADPPPEWREWFTLVADGESGLSTLR